MPYRDDKVIDVIAVLTHMKTKYSHGSNGKQSTTVLRMAAIKSIAQTELQTKRFKNIRSAIETITDACARRLQPDIANIAAFDELAGQWLLDNSMALKMILSKHAKGDSQHATINNFFENNMTFHASATAKNDHAAGAGFGNPEDNKKVETAAVDFVTKMYESKGWHVDSVEHDKCGFDLICTLGHSVENVEVKGISGTGLIFIITAGELDEAKKNSKFVLYAITQALSSPKPFRFTGSELADKFSMQPLQFRAEYKK